MTIRTKVTRKITGPYGDLKGLTLKEFANSLPDEADIQVHETKPYPGEFGGTTWTIEATWDEDS